MPIPKPNANEKESEFIGRFMADPVMVKDYPDQNQRLAIAYQTWRDKNKKQDSAPSPRTLTFHLDESRADKFQTTPEGYLVCPARPTRSGIFDYYKDGKLFRELRPPEEVFKQESLDSLRLLPVTHDHQGRIITVDNIKDHQVGMTGEKVIRDGDFVACTIKLTDKTIIDNVQSRRRAGMPVELSCGYDADMEPISGEHPTEGHYDAVQKNIKYNHVSIVDEGRAGSGARLILDQKQGGLHKMAKFKRKGIKLDSFNMDEINVEIPDGAEGIVDRLSIKLDEATEVIQAQSVKLAESQKKLDEAKAEVEKQKDATKKLDAVQAKLDQTTEQLTKATAEVTELSNMDSPRVQGMLAAKTTLEATADKLKVDRKDKAPKDIKIAVIKAVSPEFKEDGKSDEYISARYDAVIDVLNEAAKNENNNAFRTFITDAHANQGPKDPRAEFIAKSQAYGKGGTA